MNVYLDHAATTPVREEVLEEMLPLLKENYGNPDSLHAYGRRAAHAVTDARDRIAAVLGVKPNEVYFTSGGTEADNWAVRNMGTGAVAISQIEHAAALEAAKMRNGGAIFIPVPQNGVVSAEGVQGALRKDVGLVCLMAVNNETGCVQPLEEVSALCRAREVVLFSDCVQAACSLDLQKVLHFADAISLSAHKIGGPKGVGALVVKKGVRLAPLVVGGEQERGLRGGTLNAAGVVGFAKALELAQREREAFSRHTAQIRDLFEEKLHTALKNEVKIDGENRAPNLSHVTFARGGEVLLNLLDLHGVAASGGAACSAHASLPSHVMLAMGRTEQEARRGVRFSFGKETTKEEALFAADTVIRCYMGLK